MPVPRIAIVGRPNVGKSSLLNMIARERIAIVEATPGVTRDRVSVVVDLESPDGSGPDKPVEFTDTGGYGVYTAEGQRIDDAGHDLSRLTDDIEAQIGAAVAAADLILFAVDTQAGITPQDREIARMLREQRLGGRSTRREGPAVPVRVVATKCDGPKWEAHAFELAALGFGEPMACSAKSNYFRRDMLDTLYELLPEPDTEPDEHAGLRLAVIGKRNAGKSSLVNALAGERRVIASEIPGTTRDAVDVRLEIDGEPVTLIDTAGLRRKKSFDGAVEWYAFDRAKRAIDRADAILFLIDATEKISQVDEQLAMLVQKAYKPAVIVVNKWDLARGQKNAKGRPISPEDFEAYLRRELKGLDFAPIAVISAEEGLNLRPTIALARELHAQASQRVPTGELNRIIEQILERRGPSSKLGTRARIYYCAQVRTNPPTIAMVVNEPDMFTPQYRRYLMNRFRELLPFEEVPIRLIIRARKRLDPSARRAARSVDPALLDEARQAGLDPAALPEGIEVDDLLDTLPDDPDAYFED